jgi:hypothetical protein
VKPKSTLACPFPDSVRFPDSVIASDVRILAVASGRYVGVKLTDRSRVPLLDSAKLGENGPLAEKFRLEGNGRLALNSFVP